MFFFFGDNFSINAAYGGLLCQLEACFSVSTLQLMINELLN